MARSLDRGLSKDLQRHLGRCVAEAAEPVLREGLTTHMVSLLDVLDRRETARGGGRRLAVAGLPVDRDD